MHIFAVTADVELTRKPEWFDAFRGLYDEPYALHITLKQPSLVEDADIERLRAEVEGFFTSWKGTEMPLHLTFDRMNVSVRDKEDICVMIDATDPYPLDLIYRGIVDRLGTRYAYLKPQYQAYEESFHPHITIARDLTEKDYGEAAKLWTPDFDCEGIVKTCTLFIVPELNAQEANKAGNRTTYLL